MFKLARDETDPVAAATISGGMDDFVKKQFIAERNVTDFDKACSRAPDFKAANCAMRLLMQSKFDEVVPMQVACKVEEVEEADVKAANFKADFEDSLEFARAAAVGATPSTSPAESVPPKRRKVAPSTASSSSQSCTSTASNGYAYGVWEHEPQGWVFLGATMASIEISLFFVFEKGTCNHAKSISYIVCVHLTN